MLQTDWPKVFCGHNPKWHNISSGFNGSKKPT